MNQSHRTFRNTNWFWLNGKPGFPIMFFLLFSLLKYTLNSARLFSPSQNLSLLTYRTNRFVFYIQTESEFSSHHFFVLPFSLLSLLYTSKNLSPLTFPSLFSSQSRLEPYLFEDCCLLPSVCVCKVKFTINYYHYI